MNANERIIAMNMRELTGLSDSATSRQGASSHQDVWKTLAGILVIGAVMVFCLLARGS